MWSKARQLECIFSGLTLLVLVIFVGALWVFLRDRIRWDDEPLLLSTRARYSQLYTNLSQESKDLKNRLDDSTSYEWKALQWMLRHDRTRSQYLLQRHALVTIWLSFDIELAPTHECDWTPIVLCDREVVVSLNMTRRSMAGTIPSALRFLSHLQLLDLSHQNLKGRLPSIHDWKALRELRLAHNHLTSVGASLPISLEVLDGSHNDLHQISVGSLERLKHLDLGRNSHLSSESLLDELYWNTVEYLNIAETNISGKLPEGADYSSLQVLAAGYTPLVGTLPERLADASNLRILQLGITVSSKLVGTLPERYRRLTQLEQLSIVRTQISGTLPARWGQKMTSLRALDLYENPGLIGSIPDEWRGMTSLQVVRFVDTGLSGSLPSFFSDWNQLQSLSLHRTTLSGNMSEDICELPLLTRLTANCGGDNAEVHCTCCTFCWRRGGD